MVLQYFIVHAYLCEPARVCVFFPVIHIYEASYYFLKYIFHYF